MLCIYAPQLIIIEQKNFDINLNDSAVTTLAYNYGKNDDAVIVDTMLCHIGARSFNHKPKKNTNFDYDFEKCEKDYYTIMDYSIDVNSTRPELGREIDKTMETGGLIPLVFHGL